MLCTVRRPYLVVAWLAVPLLFVAAVVGLMSLGAVLLGLSARVELVTALFGAACAVAMVLGASVDWPRGWRWVRWTYPVAVFAAGVALHGVVVPGGVALLIGLSAAAALARMCWIHRVVSRQERPVCRHPEHLPARRIVHFESTVELTQPITPAHTDEPART